MLPEHEWLSKAKTLAVGQKVRVKHRNERRCNMVIANDRECWWCYCQACKEGGRADKTHVLLGGPAIVENHTQPIPHDAVPLYESSELAPAVERFLIGKDMDFAYLLDYMPRLSVSRKRLILKDLVGNHIGRDTSDKSNAKWVEYTPGMASFVARAWATSECCVIVEDAFSACKLAWCAGLSPVTIVAALGTDIQPKLAQYLSTFSKLAWFMDDDEAGIKGINTGMRYMRPFVDSQVVLTLRGDGCDPKNLSCDVLCSRLARL